MINWKSAKMAYDRVEHTIMLYRKTRHGTTTKYIRTAEDLSRVQWFLENVWKAKFRWDSEQQRIVEVE